MSYTQAIAESSKDQVLTNLKPSLDRVVATATKTVKNTIYHVTLGVIVTLLLLIIIVTIFLGLWEYITLEMGVIIVVLAALLAFLAAFIIVRATEIYSRKKLSKIAAIIYNFVSSQRLLDIMDQAAGVYLQNIPAA